jgi:WD40 repeat protein
MQVPEGLLLRTSSAADSPITCLCMQPGGVLLATCHSNGSASIWDVQQQACNHNLLCVLQCSCKAASDMTFHLEFSMDSRLGCWCLVKMLTQRQLLKRCKE